ncbi:MAG: hypothetical protein ACK4RK_12115 [Gemmataceae bacterium]
MYPLNVVLVNCNAHVTAQLRHELAKYQSLVEREYPGSEQAVHQLRSSAETMRVFMVQLCGDQDLEQIKQLHAAFADRPTLGLLAPEADPNLFSRAVRDGATLVVFLPVNARDLKTALQYICRQYQMKFQAGHLIAVTCRKVTPSMRGISRSNWRVRRLPWLA